MSTIVYKARFNGTIYTGAKPWASYSGPDKFRGTVRFHATRDQAVNRSRRTVIGSYKPAVPVIQEGGQA